MKMLQVKRAMEVEGEVKNLIEVGILTFASLSYSYHIAAKTPKGLPRLLALLPVITLLTIIPFNLHTIYLGPPLVVSLSWLTNFNLLAFAFGHGPLSPSMAHRVFILKACSPFKIKQSNHGGDSKRVPLSLVLETASKATTLLALSFVSYKYKNNIHKHVWLVILSSQIGLATQFYFSMVAIPAQVLLRVELEPQFKSPTFASSLQDFWGHRWNLRVSDTLRVIIYDPIRSISIRIIGARWASLPAVFLTFLTSGLMHELVYYNILREKPRWEVTWFFVLHGIFVDLEIILKKKLKVRLHRAISWALTVANLTLTSSLLCHATFLRNHIDERIVHEFHVFLEFFLDFFPFLFKAVK